jgi:ABC-2 type transport system permease protein
MLANVFAKTIRDRWMAMFIGAISIGLLLLAGMAAYRSIDLSIYQDMPAAFTALMNIPRTADLGALAYGAIYASYGALTLAALAIPMGSGAIAGEERDGTMGLLLANPVGRTSVLLQKVGALVIVTAFGTGILWALGVLSPVALGAQVGDVHVGALMLHMFVNALFYGSLALAISTWTGNRGLGSGVAAGIMVVSFFAAGLFPLVSGWENVAKGFPWYYYVASKPQVSGIDWGHLAVLFGCIVVFVVVAAAGVGRRDLRSQSVGVTILDRLRANPRTAKLVERLAGSTRVSDIWLKTASEHQGLLIITGYVMFLLMGIVMGPLYRLISGPMKQFGASLPPTLLAIFGGGNLSTPEGFYQVETFGMMAPLAVMVATVTIGAQALAGEEEHRTMGLLLSAPVSRARVVLEKTVTMILYGLAVGAFIFAGVWLGSVIGRLGMSAANIAATALLATLLGLLLGAVALALGAATGRVRVAVYGAVGVALVGHVLNAFLPLNESTKGFTKWTPFAYYLNSDPLMNGMDWWHGFVLLALTVLFVGLAVVWFQRRDLRQRG